MLHDMGYRPVAVNNDRDTGEFEIHLLHPGPWFRFSTHAWASATDTEKVHLIRVIAVAAHCLCDEACAWLTSLKSVSLPSCKISTSIAISIHAIAFLGRFVFHQLPDELP
jgi:hypothetical protein